MKLNHNSLSARLYRWFYMTGQMPQTLCPYFWKLVIMWIFIVPVGILSIPLTITKQEPDEWPIRIIGGIMLWGASFILFLMLVPFTYFIWGWASQDTLLGSWQGTGILIWALSIIVFGICGGIYLITKRKEKKRLKYREFIWDENGDYIRNPDYVQYEEKPNIIVEFIKAKYHKYCPKIDWE